MENMKRTLAKETVNMVDKEVLVKGWVHVRRDHGKILFIDLRDRSGLLQVVFPLKEMSEKDSEIAKSLRSEDVIYVHGIVQKRSERSINPNLESGSVEVFAKSLELIEKAETLPFDMSAQELNVELPTLLDYRGLTLRHAKVKSIFRIQEVVIDAFRRFMQSNEFMEFQAPTMIPTVPEGGAEVFEVKYFDHKVYLAQSPQLYKQILTGAFERVFSVNKICRAEPSVTTRHLTEAISLDAEMGFIDSWVDVRLMADATIKFIIKEVGEKCSKELLLHQEELPKFIDNTPCVTLREAQELIFKRTGRDIRKEKDLDPEGEREMCRWALEEHGSDLVFVSHFPTKMRPFYTYPDDENPEFNQGFDLLGKGVEWLTGGRRISNYETLMKNAKTWGVNAEKLGLYLQSFAYGMPPEGGFAFGAERITQNILGLKNIREASLFPRDMERVDFRLSTLED